MPCNGDCNQGRECNCECKDAIANQISDAITLSATAGQFKNRGTKMKHKWHDEIVAWASDKTCIEVNKAGIWFGTDYPDFNDLGLKFRIKPQPKEKKYLYVWQELNCGKVYITASSSHLCAPARHGYMGKIEVQDD